MVLTIISSTDTFKWSHHHTYHQIGEMSVSMGKTEFALEVFKEALKENPSYIPSLEQIADLNFKASRYKESLKYAKKLVKIKPDRTEYWRFVAVNEYLNGNEGVAISITETVLNIMDGETYFDSLSVKSIRLPERSSNLQNTDVDNNKIDGESD
jgi:tetratricopeptide (TPR) repeat protein